MNEKKCPTCQVVMKKIESKSKYNARVVVDQCGECGGLWFDDVEAYLVETEEGKKIENLDIATLTKNKFLETDKLLCPNDGELLKNFRDPFFPNSLQVDTCSKCQGFWMNRGEFSHFQKHRQDQATKMAANREAEKSTEKYQESDKEFLEQIDNLMLQHKNSGLDGFAGIAGHLSRQTNPYARDHFSMAGVGGKRDVPMAQLLSLLVIKIIERIFSR